MGHIRLGRLPQTRDWASVVGLVVEGASAERLAAETSRVAESGFERAPNDAGVIESFWLLTALPSAAGATDLNAELASIATSASVIDATVNAAELLERGVRKHGRESDLGQMAQLAAVETLGGVLADRTTGLFAATPSDVHAAIRDLGKEREFGHLARTFFARLTERYLSYYISRELPAHVGAESRFRSIADHHEFNEQLRVHCFEAARIVEDFAGRWYAKNAWQPGGISRPAAGRFAAIAFRKLRSELRKRGRRAA